MTRVALVSSEPIRPAMGGAGIRYVELARTLSAFDFEVALYSPDGGARSSDVGLPDGVLRSLDAGSLPTELRSFDVLVAQGWLADRVIEELPEKPLVIDLYDPWLVENLHYAGTLGSAPFRRDLASWRLQGSRGDFFMCASEVQRTFYLGLLTALGRVGPEGREAGPAFRQLIDVVPFGTPSTLPPHRPVLPARVGSRILFGGVYDWYDPSTLLDGLVDPAAPDCEILFVRAASDGTPQRVLEGVEERCRASPELRDRVRIIDRVPAERRFDLFRDVDALVSLHRPGLETRLGFRTRFLDAAAAGCPIVATAGGAMSDLLERDGAGWIVPPGDPGAVTEAIAAVLAGGPDVSRRVARARALAARFQWDQVVGPLVRFCQSPAVDPGRARALPGGSAGVGRWLRRALRRLVRSRW